KFRIRKGDQNASGNRHEVLVRTSWELIQILDKFLAIKNIGEFVKIFPEIKKLDEQIDADLIPYYLAQFAIGIKYAPYQIFAVNTLHKLLADKAISNKLKEKFAFTYIDFIKLTGTSDSLNLYEIENRDMLLRQQYEHQKQEADDYEHQILQKDGQIKALSELDDQQKRKLNDAGIAHQELEQERNILKNQIEILEQEKIKIEKKLPINILLPQGTKRREIAKKILAVINRMRWWEKVSSVSHELHVIPRYFGLCKGFNLHTRFEWIGDTANMMAVTLTVKNPIILRFQAPEENLKELNVNFGTYERLNSCKVTLELYEENESGSILMARKEISASKIEDNAYLTFSFDPIENSELKWYRLVISSPDCTPGNTIAVWCLPALDESDSQKKSGITRIHHEHIVVSNNYYLENLNILKKYQKIPNPQDCRIAITVGNNFLREVLPGGIQRISDLFSAAGIPCSVVSISEVLEYLNDPSKYNIAVFYNIPSDPSVRECIKILQSNFNITLFTTEEDIFTCADEVEEKYLKTIEMCDFFISASEAIEEKGILIAKKSFILPILEKCADKNLKEKVWETIRELIKYYAGRKLPKFSIVSVLYGKEKEILHFLESFLQQTYPGEFELIFVDDKSPDDSSKTISNYIKEINLANSCKNLQQVHIFQNETNVGNCISRNKGISQANGDIIVIIDSDCIVNKDFLAAHAAAHSFDDCDVVIGPFNIETNGRDPVKTLREYESEPNRATKDCILQDPVNPYSFLNCITRNFSIKKQFIDGDLFDPLFSYSMNHESGFGWEDIDMGYSLFKNGGRTKFISNAFSLHISHDSSVGEITKPLRSLLNFRRLFDKHPELLFVARRWTLDTYQKICSWLESNGLPANDDKESLDNRFQRFLYSPFHIKNNRRLKILTYRWHCPHQYELYKLPYDFTLVTGLTDGFTNNWGYEQRPLRGNACMKHINDVNVAEYDLAILHFDENVLAPENTNGVISSDWGANFKWFIEHLKIPIVAICHGTPQFYGQYTLDYNGHDLMQVIEKERLRLVDFLGDILVICNSYQAQSEWMFKKSKVIWHGFDPTEFPSALYNKGILTIGKTMKERPHYRGYYIFQKTFENFPEELLPDSLSVPEPHVLYEENTNLYAYVKFRNYVDNIRQYSIYFNPTLRSPMPRCRGEAMVCGLAQVSTNTHDVELFIKNGQNGFYSNDPQELREYLLYLLKNPDKCRKIGMAGRLLAMDIFNYDRYLFEWDETLSEVIR
ncbi:MAG TPA: glycosyltransferase, partial [Candidatus Brocadiaceae bacterium]